ncbi:MAG: ATP-binding cassette domain-containing protein [Nitrospirota bacterium]
MNDKPAVELINVKKSYGEQQVLKGVNLPIMEGKTTVIVGGSGQGKSQIIKHILGLIKPDSGQVMVYGKDISRVNNRELMEIRTNFGVLFQNVALFDSMTIFDNVALPLRERTKKTESEIKKIVLENLEMMDVIGHDDKYPAQISGGMKKRVGLARALVLEPKIIFFDEPTTGLDVAKSNEIYRVFFKTQTQLKYTAVIVSHDVPKIFKLADYVALLYGGLVQSCITPEEFQLSTDPVVREFVEKTMGPLYSSEMEGEL